MRRIGSEREVCSSRFDKTLICRRFVADDGGGHSVVALAAGSRGNTITKAQIYSTPILWSLTASHDCKTQNRNLSCGA
jgi:hypothetical protein